MLVVAKLLIGAFLAHQRGYFSRRGDNANCAEIETALLMIVAKQAREHGGAHHPAVRARTVWHKIEWGAEARRNDAVRRCPP